MLSGNDAAPSLFVERSTRRWLAAIAALALLLRVAFLFRGLTVVDRLFIPDDTYYTLAIARSLSQGLGPSADGVTLTSGFQPLIAFLLAPLFRFTTSLSLPVYASCALGSVADAGSALLLGWLALRWGDRRAALAAALVWALSPVAISNALNGLETTLALFLELLLVLAWDLCRTRGPRDFVAFTARGAVVGAALLARVDAAFLVAALGVADLLQRRFRGLAVTAGAAAVLVGPWWAYCWVHFGSPVPASGEAVWHLLQSHRQHYLTPPFALGWAAGALLTSPFVELAGLKEWLSGDEVLALGLFSTYVLAIVLFTRRLLVRSRGWHSPSVAFAAFSLALCLFYACYLPALWFFRRYFAPVHAFHALAMALGWAALWSRPNRQLKVASWVAASLAVVVLAGGSASLLRASPKGSLDVGLHGAKGYAEPAREVLRAVPRCAVLGALQSGALSYFAAGCPLVVGLDGVVDPFAARALREGTLASYAAARGVTYFADWPYNRAAFAFFSSFASTQPKELKPVARVKAAQGGDRFEVFSLRWQSGALGARPSPACCVDNAAVK